MGAGTFGHWDLHLVKGTWLVFTRALPVELALVRPLAGNEVPVMHIGNVLREAVWIHPAPCVGLPLLKDLGTLGG